MITLNLGKFSFLSLNFHKSSFFVLKLSIVHFSSLNFAKRFTFGSFVFVLRGLIY